MKILYISEIDPSEKFGGAVVEKKNYAFLSAYYEVESVAVYNYGRSAVRKVLDLCFSKVPTVYSPKQVALITRKIKESNAEVCFIETSKVGYFAKVAKASGKKVITFFHNCEYDFFKAVKGNFFARIAKKQEALAVKYSDKAIVLNERDKTRIAEIYQVDKNGISVCPVTFNDTVTDEDIEYMKNKKKGKKGLFFGSNFPPNYNGIRWFVENVAPKMDAELEIVGLKFDGHTELERENVTVVGTVDDLKKYVMDADFVVAPIFEGSGMKVKTCEALMYGKVCFLTQESREGYIQEENTYTVANTAEEFIEGINAFVHSDAPVYSEGTRNLFLNHYSNAVFEKTMQNILNEVTA